MKRSIELKIKVKSLAAEAGIIRHEEAKLSGMAKWRIQHHRKTVVRDAARRSLIAYMHILGHDPTLHITHDKRWDDRDPVKKMVQKYGDADALARLPELEKCM